MPATLFISDLHLAGERPAINRLFFSFLREQASRAAMLYVLGDLFEYWIGDEELDAADGDPLARKVAEAFGALSRGGVAVRLMHGNRDFLIGQRFCDGFQVHFSARYFDRLATAVVEFYHTQRLGAASLIENDFNRRERALNGDAFTLGVVDFVLGGVHFVDRLT